MPGAAPVRFGGTGARAHGRGHGGGGDPARRRVLAGAEFSRDRASPSLGRPGHSARPRGAAPGGGLLRGRGPCSPLLRAHSARRHFADAAPVAPGGDPRLPRRFGTPCSRDLRCHGRIARQRLARARSPALRARPGRRPRARAGRRHAPFRGIRPLFAGSIRDLARRPLRAALAGIVQIHGPRHRARHLAHRRDGVRRTHRARRSQQPLEGRGDRDSARKPSHPRGVGGGGVGGRAPAARRSRHPRPAGRHRRLGSPGRGLPGHAGGDRRPAHRGSDVASPPAARPARGR